MHNDTYLKFLLFDIFFKKNTLFLEITIKSLHFNKILSIFHCKALCKNCRFFSH